MPAQPMKAQLPPAQLSPAHERIMLLTLMALQFIMIVDFMIMMPLSSQLMAVFDIQPAQFGLLVSSYSIAAGVSSLLASSLADRFDRRDALLAAYIGLLVATFACAYADTYLLLIVARVIAGFFGGVLSSIVLAIVGDLFPPQKRGKAMGIVMLAFSLAAIAGVPMGLFIANHYSWQTPFSVLAIAGIVVLVVAYKVVPNVREHLHQPRVNFFQSYVELFKINNHWWAFLTSCLVIIAGFLVIPYIAPTMVSNSGMTDSQLPYIYLVGGAATLITRPWIGRMTDTYKHSKVLAYISLASFLPIVLITQTLHTPFFMQLIFATLFFVFVSGRFIPMSALVTASCEPHLRGRVMAFSSAVQNFGSGFAAFIAGVIMVKAPSGEILHYDWVGYLACAVGLIAIYAGTKVKAVS
jgi:predicted MFS family arabinose efflux permease